MTRDRARAFSPTAPAENRQLGLCSQQNCVSRTRANTDYFQAKKHHKGTSLKELLNIIEKPKMGNSPGGKLKMRRGDWKQADRGHERSQERGLCEPQAVVVPTPRP